MLDVPHTVHEKRRTAGDLAKLPDDQFVAQKIEVIQDVLFEIPYVGFVIVVRIVADENIGARNEIFQKAGSLHAAEQRIRAIGRREIVFHGFIFGNSFMNGSILC